MRLILTLAALSASCLPAAFDPPRLADGKPDLNGIWQAPPGIDKNIESRANGKIPYLPAAVAGKIARAKAKATVVQMRDPLGKCFLPGVPRVMYISDPFQIAQDSEQIAVLSQFAHSVRHIYLKRRKHLPDIDFWMGDSLGRWDGDTLVVDTADLNDQTWFDSAGNYHSDALHVVERFTRIGPRTISYEATFEDPKVFSKPWKIAYPLSLHAEKNFQILEHECVADKEGPTVTEGTKADSHAENRTVEAVTASPGQNPPLAASRAGGATPAPPPGGPVRRMPDGTPDIHGYWTARGNGAFSIEATAARPKEGIPAGRGIIVDPLDGKIPYQPWAREKEIDLSTNHMVEESDAHCYPSGLPHMGYAQFGYQIMQPRGYVDFIWEYMHAYRITPLGSTSGAGRPHVDPKLHLLMGDSRGHWDGDTLVVDVTNQSARTWFDIAANFHSDQIHVLERFTPKDENTIDYEALIEDPKVYTRPWKIAYQIGRNLTPNYELLEHACWEGERDLQQYTQTQGKTK